jgi:hypothetical protein
MGRRVSVAVERSVPGLAAVEPGATVEREARAEIIAARPGTGSDDGDALEAAAREKIAEAQKELRDLDRRVERITWLLSKGLIEEQDGEEQLAEVAGLRATARTAIAAAEAGVAGLDSRAARAEDVASRVAELRQGIESAGFAGPWSRCFSSPAQSGSTPMARSPWPAGSPSTFPGSLPLPAYRLTLPPEACSLKPVPAFEPPLRAPLNSCELGHARAGDAECLAHHDRVPEVRRTRMGGGLP